MEDKYFTPRQKELVEVAKKNGFLVLSDFQRLYSSPVSIKANIDKLMALNIIQLSDTPGRFNYVDANWNW